MELFFDNKKELDMNTLSKEDIKDIEVKRHYNNCIINDWSKEKVDALREINPDCIFWYDSNHQNGMSIVISKKILHGHNRNKKEIIHFDDLALEEIYDQELIASRIRSFSRYYPDEKMCLYKNFEYKITIKSHRTYDSLQTITITNNSIIISIHNNGMTASTHISRKDMKVIHTNHGWRISSNKSSFEFYTDNIDHNDPLSDIYTRLYRLVIAICPSLDSEQCYDEWDDDFETADSRWYREDDYFYLDI